MGKLRNIALSLLLGTSAAVAWAADGSKGTSITWNDSSWKSAPTGQAVRFASNATSRKTTNQDSSSGIRAVSLQSIWAPEEAIHADKTADQSADKPATEFLSPEAITPDTGAMNLSNQIELPDNTVIDLANPSGVSDEKEIDPSAMVPATEVPAQSTAPAPRSQVKTPSQPVPSTPFNPNLAEPVIPGAKESYEKLTENLINKDDDLIKKDGSKAELKLSETKIDRFGNIGSFINNNAVRSEDGRLLGNPYSHGIHEFHPRCFKSNGGPEIRIRTAPPISAYGEDGYGNPAINGCGTGCGTGCGIDCGTDCGLGCDTGCTTGCDTGCDIGCGTGCDMGCDTGCGSCDIGCGDCGPCDDCGTACGIGCGSCCGTACGLCPALGWLAQNMEFEAGVMAYKDAFGLGNENNFGYDLGLNWSTPSEMCLGLTGQLGGRFMQTGKEEYINGITSDGVTLKSTNPNQFFGTAGLFYRNSASPWTFGVVYDALRTESCLDYTLGQLRAELSHRCCENTDIGFLGAFATNERTLNITIDGQEYRNKLSANSYYTGFLRHWFSVGSEAMIYGGVTKESEGLIGGQIEVPITNHSSLRNNFVYVIPNSYEKNYIDNSWSINVTWVVYFGGSSQMGMANPNRPLFDVADNTSFLQRIKPY